MPRLQLPAWLMMLFTQVTHLEQHFPGATTGGSDLLAKRSVLGGLLPESLLHILESYGPGALATGLASDSDTPELIWTHKMRAQRLVPQVELVII